jgi:hypothetical protein
VRIRDAYDNVKEGGQEENGLAWLVIAVIPLSCCSMAFWCLRVCMYGFWSGAGNEELIFLSIYTSIHSSVHTSVTHPHPHLLYIAFGFGYCIVLNMR